MTEHYVDLRYLTSICPIHPEMSSLKVLCFFNHIDNRTGSGVMKKKSPNEKKITKIIELRHSISIILLFSQCESWMLALVSFLKSI